MQIDAPLALAFYALLLGVCALDAICSIVRWVIYDLTNQHVIKTEFILSMRPKCLYLSDDDVLILNHITRKTFSHAATFNDKYASFCFTHVRYVYIFASALDDACSGKLAY